VAVKAFVIAGETVKDEVMVADYSSAGDIAARAVFCSWSRFRPRLVGGGDSRPRKTLQ
jgi:hypothetical protein